jgi:hypothetical protein
MYGDQEEGCEEGEEGRTEEEGCQEEEVVRCSLWKYAVSRKGRPAAGPVLLGVA